MAFQVRRGAHCGSARHRFRRACACSARHPPRPRPPPPLPLPPPPASRPHHDAPHTPLINRGGCARAVRPAAPRQRGLPGRGCRALCARRASGPAAGGAVARVCSAVGRHSAGAGAGRAVEPRRRIDHELQHCMAAGAQGTPCPQGRSNAAPGSPRAACRRKRPPLPPHRPCSACRTRQCSFGGEVAAAVAELEETHAALAGTQDQLQAALAENG